GGRPERGRITRCTVPVHIREDGRERRDRVRQARSDDCEACGVASLFLKPSRRRSPSPQSPSLQGCMGNLPLVEQTKGTSCHAANARAAGIRIAQCAIFVNSTSVTSEK